MESDTAFVEENSRIKYIKSNAESKAYIIKRNNDIILKQELEVEIVY